MFKINLMSFNNLQIKMYFAFRYFFLATFFHIFEDYSITSETTHQLCFKKSLFKTNSFFRLDISTALVQSLNLKKKNHP